MATAARKTNWFAIWVSVAVVVVLIAVGAAVVWMNAAATAPGDAPQGEHIDSKTGAISFGDGSGTLDTYVDFMCPICNDFEQTYGDEITSLREDGTITLNVHPIAILDNSSQGTEFSTRAASAMYAVAVADYDHALAFLQAMYTNQPAEQSTGLTDDQILSIAEGAGVTMTDDLRKAVTTHRYADYVGSMTEKTPIQPGQDRIATPTIAVDGQVIANSSIPAPGSLATLFAP